MHCEPLTGKTARAEPAAEPGGAQWVDPTALLTEIGAEVPGGLVWSGASADGAHVLASFGGAERYDTALYLASTGERLQRFELGPYHLPFVVVGDVMVQVGVHEGMGPGVQGRSIETGQLLWSRPVRKTVYDGPIPP